MTIERMQGGIGWLRGAIWLTAMASLVGAGVVQADPGKSQGAARSAGKGNADWAHERSAEGTKAGVDAKDKAAATKDEAAGAAGDARDKAARKAAKIEGKQSKQQQKQQKKLEKRSTAEHKKATDAAKKGTDELEKVPTAVPAPPTISTP